MKCGVNVYTWIERQPDEFVSNRYLSIFWTVRPKCDTSFTYVYSRHVLLQLHAASNKPQTDIINDRAHVEKQKMSKLIQQE